MACGGAADDTTTDSIDPTGREWVLEELNGVADLADDRAFRTTQAVSLAVFATPDRIRTHRLANRLPASVPVSDRFRVVPLVRAVTLPHAAWVLALASALRYQP